MVRSSQSVLREAVASDESRHLLFDCLDNRLGGPAIIRAYDSSNISNELYDSTQAGIRDTAGLAFKFNVTQLLGKGFCRNHE